MVNMLEGSATISKVTSNYCEDYIIITIKDKASRIGLTCELSLENFAKCIMGLAQVDCKINKTNLENFGKKMEHKTLEFKIPCSGSKQKENAIKKVSEICPDGWEPDNYFNSQDSFFTKDGECFARCTIRRWV